MQFTGLLVLFKSSELPQGRWLDKTGALTEPGTTSIIMDIW